MSDIDMRRAFYRQLPSMKEATEGGAFEGGELFTSWWRIDHAQAQEGKGIEVRGFCIVKYWPSIILALAYVEQLQFRW